LNEFLDEKKASRIDLNTMLLVLTQLKELELMNEQENESDEYCKYHSNTQKDPITRYFDKNILIIDVHSGRFCCVRRSTH
jgi:hypothetical protein